MANESLQKAIVAMVIGGSIAVIVHLLVGSGPGLTALNVLVYVVAVRLLIAVPDLLRSPQSGTFDARSGYGAALLAIVLVGIQTVVQMETPSPTGLAVLVFGFGIAMWAYGVWFERGRQNSLEGESE